VPKAEPIAPPSLALLALEGRAWLELAALFASWPALAAAPRGDGHPVLVIPGFLGNDLSTQVLRVFLRRRGYVAAPWNLGVNTGPWQETVSRLERRLGDLAQRHGRAASLVGWSLGGVFARALARSQPRHVRQVVTLASPLRDFAANNLGRAFGRRPREPRALPDLLRRAAGPLPVPTTALVSRSDGIVAWRSCLEEPGPQREAIEVRSSHCGIGHHPAALLVVADRLAQPEGQWRPYRARPLSSWSLLHARSVEL
jgi:pimeloyl-ACP methyl ester carboxylesterase